VIWCCLAVFVPLVVVLLWLGGLVLAGFLEMLHGGSPMSSGEPLPYRSPISKLLRFFCRSRDKWKAKCQAAKRKSRSLKYCLAKMKESRDRWKDEVRSLRKSLPAEAETKKRPKHDSHGHRRQRSRPGVVAAR
jgi:hypothetical protein